MFDGFGRGRGGGRQQAVLQKTAGGQTIPKKEMKGGDDCMAVVTEWLSEVIGTETTTLQRRLSGKNYYHYYDYYYYYY